VRVRAASLNHRDLLVIREMLESALGGIVDGVLGFIDFLFESIAQTRVVTTVAA
jgi:hypothetical protein